MLTTTPCTLPTTTSTQAVEVQRWARGGTTRYQEHGRALPCPPELLGPSQWTPWHSRWSKVTRVDSILTSRAIVSRRPAFINAAQGFINHDPAEVEPPTCCSSGL